MAKICIVVVNWNAGSQLAEVVSSIAKYHNGLVSSVIIVDNASTDDSLNQVELMQDLPFEFQIVRNINNRGFGAACNQGAELAVSEYLLFLNPDTRLFESSLPEPLAFMQNLDNQAVGIVGIQLIDANNCIARSCARFPTLAIFLAQALGVNRLPRLRNFNTHITNWSHKETRTVDHVIGAFYLIRRLVFKSLDGFDERFFVYLEDLDMSLRARQAGWRSVYLSEVNAFHAGGGSSSQVKAARLFYSLRSRLLYGFKHFSSRQAWVLVLITIGLEPITRTFFSLLGNDFSAARNTWRAYGMLWRDLGSIIDKRKK